ncbi:S1C family serine protease [Frateuria defendens]|uniref:S1C family serine protease n=1 Tax=Frateuria defendens TaxID=2219559 RepID=UPI00066FE680|nr:trypsin-like peptidase domain-containing protein [Frateuria defendens]
MKDAAGMLAFVARFVVVGLAVAFVIGLIWPASGDRLRERFGLKPTVQQVAAPAPAPAPHATTSYADAVAKAAPSVVNIYANRMVTEQAVRMYSDPLMQRLFGGVPTGPAYKRPQQVLGSGVIVSAEGYVLTNNHVIANADDIQVLLYDGRVAKATLVGADEETDLAVLKIEGGSLPVIHIAALPPRAGDVVLAIGNPLGLNQTVTMGIVSAIGRQLDSSSPEDFIQTDAAINLGNSGGALVNPAGELVGINTLLIGKAANAEGIGFAIPVASAKKVLDQLIATGHVVRGWLGADYAFVPIAADSGLPAAARGAQVTDVYPGGPAAQAGLQAHDILLRIGDHDIRDPADLRRYEADLKPGSTVQVSGLRNGSPFRLESKVTQRPLLSPASAAAG